MKIILSNLNYALSLEGSYIVPIGILIKRATSIKTKYNDHFNNLPSSITT